MFWFSFVRNALYQNAREKMKKIYITERKESCLERKVNFERFYNHNYINDNTKNKRNNQTKNINRCKTLWGLRLEIFYKKDNNVIMFVMNQQKYV